MAQKPIGYIVLHGDGMDKTPLELEHGEPYSSFGTLVKGDAVTIFATRSRARTAIQRTLRWAVADCQAAGRNTYDWAQAHFYKIVRVLPVPEN